MVRLINVMGLLLFVGCNVHAQDSLFIKKKKHFIGLNTGFSKHLVKDDIISPFVYEGVKAPIHIHYRHTGKKYEHVFSAYFDKLWLTSPITNTSNNAHQTENINALFSYRISRIIYTDKKADMDVLIGGKFKSYVNFRNHYYSKDSQGVSGEQSTSLDASFTLKKRYNHKVNDAITFHFNVPVISYVLMDNMYNANVSDEIYDVNKNLFWQIVKNGDFVFFDKLFEFQSELIFTRFFTQTVGVELKHYLHFYHFKKYENLLHSRYVNNQVLIGVIINI